MDRYRVVVRRLLSAAIGATVLIGSLVSGPLGRCNDPEAVAGLSQQRLPLPPSMAMPPRQCLRCNGPAAAAPCFDTHRGFLYYRTYPWDDDPHNGFEDCPGGNCGYLGAKLSLWWIDKHQDTGHGQLRHRHHRPQHHTSHCSQCAPAPVVVKVDHHQAERHTGGAEQ